MTELVLGHPISLLAGVKYHLKLIEWQVAWPLIHLVLYLEKKNQFLN